MNEDPLGGSAGSAIAAHSKDAAAPGPTPASSTTANEADRLGNASDTVSKIADQARQAAERLSASVAGAASIAHRNVSKGSGRAADQAAVFIREQPFLALALTGAVCFTVGVLLSRR